MSDTLPSIKPFSAIVAATATGAIGKANKIPWRIRKDMDYFARTTTGENLPKGTQNAVIMGRKTWDSIPKSFRPLPKRINVVLTRSKDFAGDGATLTASSLCEALQLLSARADVADIFVIGGAGPYNESFASPNCTRIYWTHVKMEVPECDTFVDPVPLSNFALVSTTEDEQCNFLVYERISK